MVDLFAVGMIYFSTPSLNMIFLFIYLFIIFFLLEYVPTQYVLSLQILTPLHNINRQNVMANKFILGRLGENQPYKVFM